MNSPSGGIAADVAAGDQASYQRGVTAAVNAAPLAKISGRRDGIEQVERREESASAFSLCGINERVGVRCGHLASSITLSKPPRVTREAGRANRAQAW